MFMAQLIAAPDLNGIFRNLYGENEANLCDECVD